MLATAALALTGCETTITFDPFAFPEVAVEASWTADGFRADQAGCGAIGVQTVRLDVFDGAGNFVGSAPQLEANCAAGGLATVPLLEGGTYFFELVGLDAVGTIVASSGTTDPVTAFPGDVIAITGLDLIPNGQPFFDPFGLPEVSIDALWTVNGFMADVGTCAAAGIRTVRIDVFDTTDGIAVSSAALEAPCEAGGLIATDLLRAGIYVFNVRGLDGAGVVIAESGFTPEIEAFAGETFEVDTNLAPMGTVPFDPRGADVNVNGSWTINGFLPDLALCQDAGIATVRLTVFDATLTEAVDFDLPCEAGAFAEVFRADVFFTQWTALDPAGTAVTVPAPEPPEELNITAVTTANLAPFEILVDLGPPTLEITLSFENTFGAMDFTTCAGAGVDTIGFELSSNVEGLIDSQFGLPCQDTIVLDNAPPADYTLGSVTADGIDGTKWGPDAACATVGAFPTFAEDAGTVVQYDCFLLIDP
ncbi:MAG: hypothetical protein AAGH15_18665 [Myxococcota bacterium]